VVAPPRTSWPPVAPTATQPERTDPELAGARPVALVGALPSACRLEGGVAPPINVSAMPPPAVVVPDGHAVGTRSVVAGADGPRTVATATTRAGAAGDTRERVTNPLGFRGGFEQAASTAAPVSTASPVTRRWDRLRPW
jgi:hypothetical protein